MDTKNPGDRKTVFRGGIKTITLERDYSYPLLSWSPDGKNLAAIFEKRDQLYLLIYNMESQDRIVTPITKFQQINDFRFTKDPRLLVMSAVNRGQSDIYTYYIPSTKVVQITNDYHDDLEPAYVEFKNIRGIIFLSNRTDPQLKEERLDTILPEDNFDLYYYDLNRSSNNLLKVTHTPNYLESQAMQFDNDHFLFLSDDNGIKNRYAGYFDKVFSRYDTVLYFPDSTVTNPTWDYTSGETPYDSIRTQKVFKDTAITFPISDYASNIVEHDLSYSTGKVVEVFKENGLFDFYVTKIDSIDPVVFNSRENSFYRNFENVRIKREKELAKEIERSKEITTSAEGDEVFDTIQSVPYFQSNFNTAPENDVTEYYDMSGGPEGERVFKFTRVLPYKVKFSTDYVITQLDNSIIINRYDKFTPGVPVFSNPPISAMISLGISDLFENYRITGGFRLPFDFNGSEYFIAYENLRKRLDKKVLYYRKVDQQTYTDVVPFYDIQLSSLNQPVNTKIKTNYAELRLNYPFDVIRSLRWFLSYRHDNYAFRATDDLSLSLPNYIESWFQVKIEFVHDNTIKIGTNLLNGLRFKVFAEFHKEVPFEKKSKRVKLPVFNNAYLGVFGFDFRYYQKVHKQIVWANRVAWASSVGTNKLIYYLGGVDGWLGAKFDDSNPPSETNNYAFQTLATPLRGFDQNVRNGNSYILFNSEIRIPIFTYLINSAIKSQFIRNFQIVGFTDIGTAWEGLNPWDKNNPLFVETIPDPDVVSPIYAEVEFFKNPIVAGYGLGFRTSLLGYFVRMDVAWGNDSGVKTKSPKLYFSLSLDF